MKICILAFDGLEYEFVVKWKLKNLLQEYHGTYKALINPKYDKPHTPTCWASFITGKSLEEHGVTHWWRWNSLLERLRYIPPFIWIKGKRDILMKIGIKPTLRTIPENLSTIFDAVKPSVPLFIPSYNEPVKIHYMYVEASKKGLNEIVKCVWKVHKLRKDVLFKHLKNNEWKLLMCWFDLADLMSHLYTPKTRFHLLKAYLELNSIAGEVRKRIDNDTAVLIVSDHGIEIEKNGSVDHSEHGFWSLNVKPPFKPRDITDFYKLILELTGERK
ncbi:MAG: alkaline phosphatase family protein [Thermoproteales archaeon]|nr:alkaline phosphatase family protein [Thermoproteales archaeon]